MQMSVSFLQLYIVDWFCLLSNIKRETLPLNISEVPTFTDRYKQHEKTKSMPPSKIHLLRHGQGYHNLKEDYTLPDPSLTPEGERQATTVSHEIPDIFSVNCIYASPMRRTLHTALLTFKTVLHFNPNLRVIALPELQETSDDPCDTGSSLEALQEEFKGQPVDFSHVFEGWNDKKAGRFRPTTDLTQRRAEEARKIIHEEPEGTVAVVAHGGLLHYMTEDWEGSSSGSGEFSMCLSANAFNNG